MHFITCAEVFHLSEIVAQPLTKPIVSGCDASIFFDAHEMSDSNVAMTETGRLDDAASPSGDVLPTQTSSFPNTV